MQYPRPPKESAFLMPSQFVIVPAKNATTEKVALTAVLESVLAFESTCPAPPKPFTALNMPTQYYERLFVQITPTRHELTRTQEAHERHHDELHLRRSIVRQFERANLRLPVPPTIGYLDRLLSFVRRLGLGRSYMVFCRRLLWDVVRCGSFCVRHSVACANAGCWKRARLWSGEFQCRGRLGGSTVCDSQMGWVARRLGCYVSSSPTRPLLELEAAM